MTRASQVAKIVAATEASDRAADEDPGGPAHQRAWAVEEAARRNATPAEEQAADAAYLRRRGS